MQRRSLVAGLAALGMLARGGDAHAQPATTAIKSDIAPTGTLRVAINYGNAALASRDAAGALHGVSVDIAQELGKRLDLPLTLIPFDAAGKVSAAASGNVWDVAFLARDPERARGITFTAAYVVIDGNYVVPRDSPITTVAQADQDGIRVAVSTNSAYDLFLRRTLKHAQLVHGGSTPEAVALFRSQRLEVLAGVKQALDQVVLNDPGLRMIAQPFMAINQAMGTPSGRPAAAAYLATFVEDIKASGFVAQMLKKNGQADATVAPPG